MPETLPVVYLVRHGEMAWNVTGRHAGLVDLPLNDTGERDARLLGARLRGLTVAQVFTSPLQRVSRTCELAGFKAAALVDPDLLECNYGDYEGKTTQEMLAERPGWRLYGGDFPGGETAEQVALRADRVIGRVRGIDGNVLLFSSGHFLRVLAARWLGLEGDAGRLILLSTASLSALGYEADRLAPVIRFWNDTSHLG